MEEELIRTKAEAIDKGIHAIKAGISHARKGELLSAEQAQNFKQLGDDMALALDKIYESIDIINGKKEGEPT